MFFQYFHWVFRPLLCKLIHIKELAVLAPCTMEIVDNRWTGLHPPLKRHLRINRATTAWTTSTYNKWNVHAYSRPSPLLVCVCVCVLLCVQVISIFREMGRMSNEMGFWCCCFSFYLFCFALLCFFCIIVWLLLKLSIVAFDMTIRWWLASQSNRAPTITIETITVKNTATIMSQTKAASQKLEIEF